MRDAHPPLPPPPNYKSVYTHARVHARIRDVMNVKLNDAPPRSRESGDCVCFIQEVLIIMPRHRRPNIALHALFRDTLRSRNDCELKNWRRRNVLYIRCPSLIFLAKKNVARIYDLVSVKNTEVSHYEITYRNYT